MPSLEQSERTAGAAFLSVPALDGFVWALDNWARMELLMKLHDQLPAFLVNPATAFICTCIGLYLLYRSNVHQLRRVAASESRLVDTSGAEYRKVEKPKWLLPVLGFFSIALIATPILAVGYSLAYKGISPRTPRGPIPPYFAYLRTPPPTPPKPPFRSPSQIAPGGINIGRDNRGTAIVNNFAPQPLTITSAQERQISQEKFLQHFDSTD